MGEKRKFARLNLNVRVDWRKTDETVDVLGKFLDATRNISAGGLCLSLGEELQVGDKLYLKMELPSKQIISAKGQVVWVSQFEVDDRGYKKMYNTGIKFIEIRDEDRQEINEFVLASLPPKKE